ncbi:LuxR C-terminal-related transcriptional regulator, partial [Microvirga sp. P5_D2]
ALIADPDQYFRLALEAILIARLGYSSVIQTASLDEALDQLLKQPNASMGLFELNMPGMMSATSLAAVRDCFPNVRVVVVSTSIRRQDILMALDAGVHGYIPKNVSPDELATALKIVRDGAVYVPPSVASTASLALEGQVLTTRAPKSSSADMLTQRQREVLELLLEGKSNKEIARMLNLGEGTVKIHMAALFRTFRVNTRAAAAAAGAQLLRGWYSGA